MKKLFLSSLALIALISVNSYGKLLAYWSFDDGTAKDNSGNGYDGIMINNPISVPGVHGVGQAMSFKGKGDYSTINSSLDSIGSHINLPEIDLSLYSSYTIALWVNDSMSDCLGEAYISFGDNTSSWIGLMRHTDNRSSNSDSTFYLFSSAGNTLLDGLIRYPFNMNNLNKWMHYALVYNSGTLKTYIDGAIAYTQTGGSNNKISSHSGLACLFWDFHGEHRKAARFTGALDEVMIFNEALSDSAIKEIVIGTPPKITSTTSDCYQKIYELKADSVSSISIVSNDNTSIAYSPKTPAKVVDITVKLINKTSNGYYTIKVVGTNEQSIIIKDSISTSADASLNAVYTLGASYYRLDSTGLGNTIYADVSINNPSNTAITIDNAYFIYNTEYSVMPSQLPITISANSVGEIKVAFNPTTLKERIDTLYIPQACGIMKIPFNTICKANIYDINGECDAQITTTSSAITPKYLSVSPNPAVNKLKVKMKTAKGAQASNFEIVNSLGESARFTAIISSRCDDGDSETIECQIDISALKSGVYQVVYSGDARIAQSFVVNK